jgi:hypothetical protein
MIVLRPNSSLQYNQQFFDAGAYKILQDGSTEELVGTGDVVTSPGAPVKQYITYTLNFGDVLKRVVIVPDSDGDGINDGMDYAPTDPTNWEDPDRDNDGVPNETSNSWGERMERMDAFPDDPTEWNDADGDNVGDNADAFPYDTTEWHDTDRDKVGDNADAFPNDPTEWNDADGDEMGDNADAFPNDPSEWNNADGDEVGDNADAFPNDPTETKDTDGDQVGDNADISPDDAYIDLRKGGIIKVTDVETLFRYPSPLPDTWDQYNRPNPVWEHFILSDDKSIMIAMCRSLTSRIVFISRRNDTTDYSNVVFPKFTGDYHIGAAGLSGDGQIAAVYFEEVPGDSQEPAIRLFSTQTGQQISTIQLDTSEHTRIINTGRNIALSQNGDSCYYAIAADDFRAYIRSHQLMSNGVWEQQSDLLLGYRPVDGTLISICLRDGLLVAAGLYRTGVVRNMVSSGHDRFSLLPHGPVLYGRIYRDPGLYSFTKGKVIVGYGEIDTSEGAPSEQYITYNLSNGNKITRVVVVPDSEGDGIVDTLDYFPTDPSESTNPGIDNNTNIDGSASIHTNPEIHFQTDTFEFDGVQLKLTTFDLKTRTIVVDYSDYPCPFTEFVSNRPLLVNFSTMNEPLSNSSTEIAVVVPLVVSSDANRICVSNPVSRRTVLLNYSRSDSTQTNYYISEPKDIKLSPHQEVTVRFMPVYLRRLTVTVKHLHGGLADLGIYAYSVNKSCFIGSTHNNLNTTQSYSLDLDFGLGGFFDQVTFQIVTHDEPLKDELLLLSITLFDTDNNEIVPATLSNLKTESHDSDYKSNPLYPGAIFRLRKNPYQPSEFLSWKKVLDVPGDTSILSDNGILVGSMIQSVIHANYQNMDNQTGVPTYIHGYHSVDQFSYINYLSIMNAYHILVQIIKGTTPVSNGLIEMVSKELNRLNTLQALYTVEKPIRLDRRLLLSILPDHNSFNYILVINTNHESLIQNQKLDPYTGLWVIMKIASCCSIQFGKFEGSETVIDKPVTGQIILNNGRYRRYFSGEWVDFPESTVSLVPDDQVTITRLSKNQYQINLEVYYPFIVHEKQVVTQFPLVVDVGDRVFVNNCGLEFTTDGVVSTNRWDQNLDMSKPEIFLNGVMLMTTPFDKPFLDAGVVALDRYGQELQVYVEGNIVTSDVSKIGVPQVLVYTAADNEGVFATQIQRTVTVVIKELPLITIQDDPILIYGIVSGSSYTDAGATALDQLSSDVIVSTHHAVNLEIAGEYTVQYTAADSYGNVAEKTRLVRVLPTPTYMHLNGPPVIYVHQGGVYNDLGFTLDENASSFDVTTNNSVDINVLGRYTVNYDVNEPISHQPIARLIRIVEVVSSILTIGELSSTSYTQFSPLTFEEIGPPSQIYGNISVVMRNKSVKRWKGLNIDLGNSSVYDLLSGAYTLTYSAESDNGSKYYGLYNRTMVIEAPTVKWNIFNTSITQFSSFDVYMSDDEATHLAQIGDIGLSVKIISVTNSKSEVLYTDTDLGLNIDDPHELTKIQETYILTYIAIDNQKRSYDTIHRTVKVINATRWYISDTVVKQFSSFDLTLPDSGSNYLVVSNGIGLIAKIVLVLNNAGSVIYTEDKPTIDVKNHHSLTKTTGKYTITYRSTDDNFNHYGDTQRIVEVIPNYTTWIGPKNVTLQQNTTYTTTVSATVHTIPGVKTKLASIEVQADGSQVGTDVLQMVQNIDTYNLTFKAVHPDDDEAVYDIFHQMVEVTKSHTSNTVHYSFEKVQYEIIEGEDQYEDTGAYITNNGTRELIINEWNNVDPSNVGTYQAQYLLPDGNVYTEDILVKENPFLDTEILTTQEINHAVVDQLKTKSKKTTYDIIRKAIKSKPSQKSTVPREYLAHILPVKSEWKNIEVHIPTDDGIVDFDTALPLDTGRLLITTMGASVNLDVGRYIPVNGDSYQGRTGQIIRVGEVFKEFTPSGWEEISNAEENLKAIDRVKIVQTTDSEYSIEAISGVPTIIYNQKLVTGQIKVGESSQIYINNTGCILGSILQTDGYMPDTVSSTISGDPYVRTMSGSLYKLPNRSRIYRLLETEEMVINAEVRPLNSAMQKERQKLVDTFGIDDKTHNNEYFIDGIFIRFQKDGFLLCDAEMNITRNTMIGRRDVQIRHPQTKKYFVCPIIGSSWYSSTFITLLGKYRKYYLELRRFDHPQVVNGLSVKIKSRPNVNRISGVLTGMKYRNCIVKKIDSCKSVPRDNSLQSIRMTTEHWKKQNKRKNAKNKIVNSTNLSPSYY